MDRRDELDLSNREVASRMGISEGYLRNILSGSDSPGRRRVYALERALRLPKGALLIEDEPKHEPGQREDEHVSPEPLPQSKPDGPTRPPNKPRALRAGMA